MNNYMDFARVLEQSDDLLLAKPFWAH